MVPAALGGLGSPNFDKALTPESEGNDKWKVPGIASDSIAEASLLTPEGNSSTKPEIVPGAPSGATTSKKPEAIPASGSETAPRSAPEATPSIDPENVLESAPEVAASSIPEAAYSKNPEKVPTSTVPVPNGKGSSASSNLDKEMDLEMGHRSDDSEKKDPETTRTKVDPNIVDWDGPEDPQNPVNWSEKLKWANVAIIASITFLTQVILQASSREYKMLT